MTIHNRSLTDGGKQSFEAIDLMKFICAILVVAIHILPFKGSNVPELKRINSLVHDYLGRIAVPFFFMSSGFLVFRKIDRANVSVQQVKGYALKLIRLYLLWALLYLEDFIRRVFCDGRGILRGLLLYLRDFLTAGYIQLWYLPATALAVVLVAYLLNKKLKISTVLGVAFIFYAVGLLMMPYFGLVEPLRRYPVVDKLMWLYKNVLGSPRNGLLFGFLFVGMGMMFAYKPVHMPMRYAVLGFAASMAAMLAEVLVLMRLELSAGYDISVFLVPASFFLFYIVSHIELQRRSIYGYLRISSSLVFFVHNLVARVLWYIFKWIKVDVQGTLIPFALTLLCSILVSHVIIRLSAHPKCTWLKRLYS